MSPALIRLMPAVIEKFRKRHDTIAVEVNEVDATGSGERVRNGEVDFAISVMFKQELTLHFVPLIEDNLHLVCRRDHEFASRARLSWSEFSDYDERRTIRWSGIEHLIADAGGPGGVQSSEERRGGKGGVRRGRS